MDHPASPLDDTAAYRALQAHDARFDGRLFVGVTSTGIYCRPVCRVKLPRRENCRFYAHAAQAEQAGFRPCLRCRPELAPGLALIDGPHTLALQAMQLIDAAAARGDPCGLPHIAALLGVSDRHLRRIFQEAHGVKPIDYLATRRLLQAKGLLTDTALPITQVALASGFASLRRFNAAFAERYRMNPSQLRAQRGALKGVAKAAAGEPGAITVRLAWRPPFDSAGLLAFIGERALAGIEAVSPEGVLRRTLTLDAEPQRSRVPAAIGWIEAAFDHERHTLALRLAPTLAPRLPEVLQRVRQALDLDADPAGIDAQLIGLPRPAVAGLRVPGSFDGFETAVRVVLGQQISVAAARTLAQRLAECLGEPVSTPWPGLNRLFPRPQALAEAD
ncbi:MAG: Ada metal-binding domain-containing protein, partial [Burkholderiales bacterium]